MAGLRPGDEPLTLKRFHSCELPHLYEALEGWDSVCDQVYSLRYKGENFSFSDLLALLIFYCSSFHGMMRTDPAVRGNWFDA